ncbi:MAG: hypothetical protein M0R34_06510, partial [Candidatus Marinimicrobia bacterium]|nr:hypothetical protein [Candidatus Neomarinimicrobiota bacterium]
MNATSWQWQAKLPTPKVSVNNKTQMSSIELPGLENSANGGYPSLPVYRKLFNALPEEITYQVQSGGQSFIQLPAPAEIFWDIPVDGSDSPLT